MTSRTRTRPGGRWPSRGAPSRRWRRSPARSTRRAPCPARSSQLAPTSAEKASPAQTMTVTKTDEAVRHRLPAEDRARPGQRHRRDRGRRREHHRQDGLVAPLRRDAGRPRSGGGRRPPASGCPPGRRATKLVVGKPVMSLPRRRRPARRQGWLQDDPPRDRRPIPADGERRAATRRSAPCPLAARRPASPRPPGTGPPAGPPPASPGSRNGCGTRPITRMSAIDRRQHEPLADAHVGQPPGSPPCGWAEEQALHQEQHVDRAQDHAHRRQRRHPARGVQAREPGPGQDQELAHEPVRPGQADGGERHHHEDRRDPWASACPARRTRRSAACAAARRACPTRRKRAPVEMPWFSIW